MKSLTLTLLIICVFAALLGSIGAKDNQIENLFKEFFESDQNKCWKTAVTKIPYGTTYMWEKRLVNVYTQSCYSYKDGNTTEPFYKRLNNELRGNPSGQWKTTETLLNNALDIIGTQQYSTLYRSCHCNNLDKGHTIVFKAFTSTSIVRDIAAGFLAYPDNDVFMSFNNTDGTQITDYSYYSDEAEVLLKSGREFEVVEAITDGTDINTKLHGIPYLNKVRVYTILRPVTGGRRRRQSSEIASCSCSRRGPANNPNSSTKNGLTFYVWVLILCATLSL